MDLQIPSTKKIIEPKQKRSWVANFQQDLKDKLTIAKAKIPNPIEQTNMLNSSHMSSEMSGRKICCH
jgi:hypothetical protein